MLSLVNFRRLEKGGHGKAVNFLQHMKENVPQAYIKMISFFEVQ